MRRLISFHRWLGIICGVLVLIPTVTALVMNHRSALESPSQTAPASGPFDAWVLCATVDPRNADHLWIGTADGLFRSRDGGRTFAAVSLPVEARQVHTVMVDPHGSVTVGLRYSGILESDDDATTWTRRALAPGEQLLALSRTTEGSLVAVTSAGVRRIDGTHDTLVARPPARDSQRRAALRWVYDLHDGQAWGRWGVWITDLSAVSAILLVVSGSLAFVRTRRVRRAPE